jgi:5-hydroxyisourate hydrolase-like protein (transthyretin family)
MGSKLTKPLVALTILIVISCLFPPEASAGRSVAYHLLDQLGGSPHYRLNVVVSESLLGYYLEKSHMLITNNDFAKFVTPYALKPIADNLRQIYPDDEDFVNGVLMIVHQIPYEETKPPKYPVETIAEDKGDCDVFSYVAASIIIAGGLNVVLLYYESESHMNIGVNLSQEPYDVNRRVDYVMHDGAKFYVGECTGDNWQSGWRVGECPDSLKNASVQLVTLESCEQTAPGQVSASYKSLQTSTLSLSISTAYLVQGSPVTLAGQLTPALQNKTVTIYIKANNSPWTALSTVATDSSGRFEYVWNGETSGICNVQASWSGDDDYAPADSPTRTVTVLSVFLVSLLAIAVILAGLGVVVFLMSKQNREDIPEPRPPEIPD